MADSAQIESLLRMLLNAMGAGMGGGPGSLPSDLNLANSALAQPSMLSGLLGGFLPSFKMQAPPTVLVSHFEEMQKRSSFRMRVNDFYTGYSPTAIKALEKLGVDRSTLVDANGQPTGLGRAISMGWNPTMGQMIGDPQVYKSQTAAMMKDVYQGVYFGRRGGAGGFGLTDKEISGNISAMHGLAYKGATGMFQRGPFNSRDMFEIQRMGVERGMMGGGDVSQLTNRTEGLAKTVKLGMAVFNTMNKEHVLENLQRMTAGTVSLTNTGSLDSLMMKVAGLAKAANVSVETMSRIAAEGASLYKQMGITGTGGAVAHMQTAFAAKLLTSNVGGASAIDPTTVARAGGFRNVVGILQQGAAGFAGSQFYQQSAFFARQGLGQVSTDLAAQGMNGTYNVGSTHRGLQALAAKYVKSGIAPGVAQVAARAALIAGQGAAASDQLAEMQERGRGFEMMVSQNRAQFDRDIGLDEDMRKFMRGPIANKEDREVRLNILSQRIMTRTGFGPAESRVIAEQQLKINLGTKEELDKYREIFNLQGLSNAATEAKEGQRSYTSAAERVMKKVKGRGGQTTIAGLAKAIFMGDSPGLAKLLSNPNMSSSDLDAFVRTARPTDIQMNQLILGNNDLPEEQKHMLSVLTAISGSEAVDLETFLGGDPNNNPLTTLQSALESRGSSSDDDLVKMFQRGSMAGNKTVADMGKDFSKFYQNKEINLETMSSFVQTNMNMSADEARKWLSNTSNMAGLLRMAGKAGLSGKVSRLGRLSGEVAANGGPLDALKKTLAEPDRKLAKEALEVVMRGDAKELESWRTTNPGKYEALERVTKASGRTVASLGTNQDTLKFMQEMRDEELVEKKEIEDDAVSGLKETMVAGAKELFQATVKPTTEQAEAAKARLEEFFGKDMIKEHGEALKKAGQEGGAAAIVDYARQHLNKQGKDVSESSLPRPEDVGYVLREISGINTKKKFEDLQFDVGEGKDKRKISGKQMLADQATAEGGDKSIIDILGKILTFLENTIKGQPLDHVPVNGGAPGSKGGGHGRGALPI